MSGYRINDSMGREAATAETLADARGACKVLTEETGEEHTWAPILPGSIRKHLSRIDRRAKHLDARIADRGESDPGVSYDRAERGTLLWVRGVLLAAHEDDMLVDLDARRPI